MPDSKNGQANVLELAIEITESQADTFRYWERLPDAYPDADNGIRRDLAAGFNRYGYKDDMPGALPHIEHMAASGEIQVRNIFNGMLPLDFSVIGAHPENWYLSAEDAEKVRAQLLPKTSQTIAGDESTCDAAELVRNGEPIQWAEYWLNRQEITSLQAAKLAHCIDPIKWPDNQCKQGQTPEALRIKIQRCAESLAERNQTWTLAALVEALGKDAAPHGMKQAVWLESARLAHDQQIEEMQKAGRYTLEVAAELLEQSGQARATSILEKLKRAVKNRILPVHEPDPRKLERLESETVRDFYEVAMWENLNTWLAVNQPEITWRFPAPVSQKVGTGQTANETTQARKDRLRKRCNELKSKQVKAWKAQVAREEGISPQRLHDLINEKKPKSKKASAPDWFK